MLLFSDSAVYIYLMSLKGVALHEVNSAGHFLL